jgi:dTDP-4-dehydrorhamnose 3,5-epimerase
VNVDETPLPGVKLVTPKVFGDARGFFLETFSAQRYAEAGIGGPFVQDNWSRSAKGILRGLHLQHPNAQGKLVSVMRGAVYDVAVDVRVGSPHFGRWFGCELSESNKQQLWVPPGFAHGFCVLSDEADFVYKCTQLYAPAHELSVRWDDPALGIAWPLKAPQLSKKDAAALTLAELTDRLPRYAGS